jgi:translation initiation factor 2B subunit (eIF-2B alpha/beta/delta family)
MDWIGALLLGLVSGGTIGALLTVSHERAERFRDRQFEAASGFIAVYESTLDAVVELWTAATNVDELKAQIAELTEPLENVLKEAVGIEDVIDELNKAINVGIDLVGREALSEHAAAEIARSRTVIEQAIDKLSSRTDEPFASSTRELLRAMQDGIDALAQLTVRSRLTRNTLHRLLTRVAQLNLLFAGKDTEVVEAARQTAEALVALARRVIGLFDVEDPDDESDAISDAIQGANQLLADFGSLANDRVRPRPFLHDVIRRGEGSP